MLTSLFAMCVPSVFPAQAATDSTVSVQQRCEEVLFDEPGDGALYAVGSDWKARFAADGVTFVPFLGSDAPRNAPVRFVIAEVTVSGEQIVFSRAAAVNRTARTIRYVRGALDEVYEASLDGLEQRFVFDRLDSRGEIVVRGAVETDLSACAFDEAIELTNERGGVRYSQAVAIDGSGRRCDVLLRWAAGSIELCVPHDFVREAELPLMIDLRVETLTVASEGPDEIAPDVVFREAEAPHAFRFTVWEVVWSAVDHDVFARLLDEPSGQSFGYVIDATTEYWARPKTAAQSSGPVAVFGIVAEVGAPGSQTHSVRGRRVATSSTVVGPAVTVSAGTADDNRVPDIGADSYPEISYGFVVVWQRTRHSGEIDVVGRRAEYFLTPPTTPILGVAVEPAIEETHPAISKSNGNFELCVVWERRVDTANRDVWGRRIDFQGQLVGPAFPISTAPDDETHPSVSSRQSSPARFVVAFERDRGSQCDIVLHVVNEFSVLERVELGLLEGGAHAALDQTSPAVDGQQHGYLVTYREPDPIGGTLRTRMTVFELNQAGGVVLHAAHLALGGVHASSAEVCARAANFGSPGFYDLAWSEPGSAVDLDVQGALFQDGVGTIAAICFGNAVDKPCPCVSNGGVPAGCPNSVAPDGAELTWTGQASLTADTLAMHVSRLPPGAVVALLQGNAVTYPPIAFGDGLSCVGRAKLRIVVSASSGAGTFDYPVAGDPEISIAGHVLAVGSVHVYQIVYRDRADFCTPGDLNATNALRVAWSQ